MDKNYLYILIGALIFFVILSRNYFELYPAAGYVRSETMGKLLPRARDRDTNPAFQLSGKNNRDHDESNDREVQHINLDETSGNYVWNSYLNFPYGGYIYNSSYPVYLASNICPPEKPYYNTIDGQCIFVDINIVKNAPSGAPDKIFNSDLPGYVYSYTPSVFTNVVS
jgi:hypothetical protein